MRKPKRLTREELEAKVKQLDQNYYLEMMGLNIAINAEYDYITPRLHDSGQHDGGSYVFRLGRSTSPCGGFVLVTFHYDGQRDTTNVRLFEEFFQPEWYRFWPSDFLPELDKLRAAREQKIRESE